MKYIDQFIFKDIIKSIKKIDIAFYIDDILPYNMAMASIRMRTYDIINYFETIGIHAELYKPFKKYRIVIFTKTCSDKSLQKAKELHEQGTKIYFESHCEYLCNDEKFDYEKKNILKMLEYADIVGTASEVQQEMFANYHNHVVMIPESVNADFFLHSKKHSDKQKISLLYCGYSVKAKDTLCIVDVIKTLQKEYGIEMIYICEKDPEITEIPYRFINYDQKKIPDLLIQGDIMIAPRIMDGLEQRSHSFTKVAYPLAVGLPTVASPMPSYLNTPVIICNTAEEWHQQIKQLIIDWEKRAELAEIGINYVKDNYSINVIGQRYMDVIKELDLM